MKVFGIGWHKTGTTSLARAFRHWKLKARSFDRPLTLEWLNGDKIKSLRELDRYNAFEDWPWPWMYREMYERYPTGKFILTTRVDEEAWFASLQRWAEKIGIKEVRTKLYGYEMPNDNKQAHIDMYRLHNQQVREFFADKPGSLLEVCFENGDGWKELGEFLNLPILDIPFPHANKTEKK